MSDSVLSVLDDGVLTVTLNEPDTMNALSAGIAGGLVEAVKRASEDDDVRVMVLTGAGRGFCAGAAVGAGGFPGSGDGGGAVPSRRMRMDKRGGSAATVELFANCDVPIIAAINGPAAGAGFGIATCCDVRFMAESAKIGVIFIKRGVASDYGVAYWLPRIVGMQNAFDLMYTGDLLTAQECKDIGLVKEVVADDEVVSVAQAYARRIADGPPLAYTTVRRMLQRSTNMQLSDFVEYEWTGQTALLGTSDVTEGFTAFIEKRKPNFKGK